MPYAVTHVILTIVLVDFYRDYWMRNHKRYLTLHTIFLAGVGGVLPDIDYLLYWLAQTFGYAAQSLTHGGVLHTPIMALPFLASGYWFWKQQKHRIAMVFFAITFGVLFHLVLDYLIWGESGVMWLWPLRDTFYVSPLFQKPVIGDTAFAMLDGIILLLWLWHEEWKHKISDYL